MQEQIIQLLYRALAEEFVAFYQYFITKDILVGPERENIKNSFEEYAFDELQDHSQKLIDRLTQLDQDLQPVQDYNNFPNLTPNTLKVLQSNSVIDALQLNINAEENAIQTYTQIVETAKNAEDPVTEKMAKEILTDEEEHLRGLKDYLDDITSLFKAREDAKNSWLVRHGHEPLQKAEKQD